MNCQRIQEMLDEYLDGELDALVAVQVERHLSGCPQCSVALDELRELVRLCRCLPVAVPPMGFHQRLMEQIEARAAGAAGPSAPAVLNSRGKARRWSWSAWPSWAAAAVLVASVGLAAVSGVPAGQDASEKADPVEISRASQPDDQAEKTGQSEPGSQVAKPSGAKSADTVVTPAIPAVVPPNGPPGSGGTPASGANGGTAEVKGSTPAGTVDTGADRPPATEVASRATQSVAATPSFLVGSTEIKIAGSNFPVANPKSLVIRRINLTVASEDPRASTRELIALLRQVGGQRLVSSQSGGEIHDEVLVPASKESEFFAGVLELGRVTNSQTDVEDITARVTALDERLLYLKSGIEIINSDTKVAVMKNEYEALAKRREVLRRASENMEVSLTWIPR